MLLTARQLRGAATMERTVAHLHHIQRPLNLLFNFGLAHAANLQRESEVFRDRHVREQSVVLKHHADAAFVRRYVIYWIAVEANVAMGGGFKPRQHHQARRFARTRRAQHGQKLAFADAQVQVFDDESLTIITFLYALKRHESFCSCSIRHSGRLLYFVWRFLPRKPTLNRCNSLAQPFARSTRPKMNCVVLYTSSLT